jgi:hypothetical protein
MCPTDEQSVPDNLRRDEYSRIRVRVRPANVRFGGLRQMGLLRCKLLVRCRVVDRQSFVGCCGRAEAQARYITDFKLLSSRRRFTNRR